MCQHRSIEAAPTGANPTSGLSEVFYREPKVNIQTLDSLLFPKLVTLPAAKENLASGELVSGNFVSRSSISFRLKGGNPYRKE